MGVEERDPHTGHATTGHEWNGIKELNTPVPRAVFFFLAIAVLFSIGYWILMPTWPLWNTYTKGLLRADQQASVDAVLRQAADENGKWKRRIIALPVGRIRSEPDLMKHVRETGHTLFGDNCAGCHGKNAQGGPGFPGLTTASWLWGGDADAMAKTIRVGVNASHPDTRLSQMPAFGSTSVLTAEEIDSVVVYVQSLSDARLAKLASMTSQLKHGRDVFVANCVSCHGVDGRGDHKVGAPDLTDKTWIYGRDRETISMTVWGGRQGTMPSWEGRLAEADRKILLLYLMDKRGGSQ